MDSEIFLTQPPASRAYTVVPARRLRIRRLTPGASFVESVGKHQRIVSNCAAEKVEFPLVQRLVYSFHLKRAAMRFDPVSLFSALGRAGLALPSAIGGAFSGSGATFGKVIRLAAKAIAIAVVALLAVSGVSRFVHIDLSGIAQSVHFALPHFLTPWRPIREVTAVSPTKDAAAAPVAASPALIASAPDQYAPIDANPAHPVAGQPAQTPATYVPQYYRQKAGDYLPMPSDGPLPAGMSTYVSATTPPVRLSVHPAFTEPEEQQPEDDIVLMPTKPQEVKEVVAAQPEHKEKERPAPDKKQDSRPVHLVTHAPGESAAAIAPAPAVAKQAAPRAEQPRQATGDIVLLQQPAARQSAADQTDDDDTPVAIPVHSAARAPADDQSASGGTNRPKFTVVTHTDDSIVVRVGDGQMKQISIGQELPDGSKLLSVDHNDGGFKTNRGSFAAY